MERSGNMSTANCSHSSSPIIDTIDSLVCTLIAVFGLIGNIFSIAVFHQTPKLRRLSSSVYLMALAVSDTLFLTTLLLSTLALFLLKRSLFCKAIFYFMNVSGVFSSWLVVVFTVERFLVVMYPFTRMGKCSRRRAQCMVSFLLPVPFLMYIYTALTLIDVDPVTGVCHWRREYVFTVTIIHSIEIWLIYFIPALIVVALNLRIGLQLIKSHAKRQCMIGGNDEGTNAEDEGGVKRTSFRLSRSRSSKTSMLSMGRLSITNVLRTPSAGELAATRTLIVISTAFAILNLPHNLVLLTKLVSQVSPASPDSVCYSNGVLMDTVTSMCNALYYANFAVNIVVYHLTSTNYRQGARQLWKKSIRSLSTTGRKMLFCLGNGTMASEPAAPPSALAASMKKRSCGRIKRKTGKKLSIIGKFGNMKRSETNSPNLTDGAGQTVVEKSPNGPVALSTIPEGDIPTDLQK